ncbi:GcrA family cell cycle regulator [Maritalea mediterranea]|uniref:GcrA cell cycle regulator n=1 Tax=Maritalea mediterranea TaxID=2909667 RepID=A0ABS9E3Y6_9HYPH|nr:GcrA family cell cycle regulator [Maritalea mediterranea]MCF4097585.1 GcrA cell cycle regulator [Maritalea mediterranea]
MAWTDERVAILKKLWMEGLSASQIAAELGEGVTRNAVIGKVHRLKLSGRAKPASSAPRARKPRATASSTPRRPSGAASNTSARPAASSRPAAASSAPRRSSGPAVAGNTALKMSADTEAEQSFELNAESEIFIPEAERIGLMELNEHTCKWPIGDPVADDFHFCGRHSDEGKPYCEFHSKRAYHSLDRRKKS